MCIGPLSLHTSRSTTASTAISSRNASRSLGTYMILDHVARARALRLPYLYLGYWVEGSPKMHYKARFLPQERLMPQGWARIER